MALTRVQRSLLFAVVLLGGGGAAAVYTLKTKVKTPDERFREERDALRLFHFGRAHVKQGRLTSRTATLAFARSEDFGWVLTEPVGWPADDKAIDAMLDRMAGIIGDPTITEDATPEDLARTGLDAPETRLEVALEGGEQRTLLVGAKNKMVNKFPVTDGAKQKIALSEAQFVWSMDRGLFEFRDKRIFPIPPGAVTRVELSQKGAPAPIEMVRADELWRLRGPGVEGEIQGDAATIDFLLTALTKRMKVERFVDDTFDPTSSPERYGLDAPDYVVTLETKGGLTRTVRLSRYRETGADEGTAYAFVEGTTSAVAMRKGVVEALEPAAGHYRDRSLSRFSLVAVKKLQIEIAREPKIELSRTDDDGWKMTAPKAAATKVWRVDAIVRPLAHLRVERWKTEAATKAQKLEWLLEPWSRRIVVLGEGDAVLADVRFGNLADDEHIFAMVAGDDRVGLVPVDRLRALPSGIADLVAD